MRHALSAGIGSVISVAWLLLGALSGRSAAEADEILIHQKLPRVPLILMVEGKLGGTACQMIVDTGAEFTTFDSSLRNQAKGKIAGASVTDANGNQLESSVYRFSDLSVQELKVKDLRGAVIDLKPFSRRQGGRLNAVLGWPELKAGKLWVSMDDGLMELHTGPWKLTPADSAQTNLNTESGIPAFETEIAGHRGQFVIDTGSDGGIGLPDALFELLAQEGYIEVSSMKSGSLAAGGNNDQTRGWFLKGKWMGRELKGVSVVANGNGDHVGRIGMKWLSGFNFEIDSAAQQWRYQVRPRAALLLDCDMMLGGLLAFQDGEALIKYLWTNPQGALRSGGLQEGDVIHRFDRLQGDELNLTEIGGVMAAMAGKSVNVTYTRGAGAEEKSVVLHIPPAIREGEFVGRNIYDRTVGPGMSESQKVFALFGGMLRAGQLLRSTTMLFTGCDALPIARLRVSIHMGVGNDLIRAPLPAVPDMVTFEAEIGGRKGVVLLNAGSQLTTIDQSLCDAVGGKEIQGKAKTNEGGALAGKLCQVPELRLQSLVAKESTVLFMDMGIFTKFTGHKFIGALGAADLSRAKVLLNYDAGLLDVHTGPWMLEGPTCQEAELEDYRPKPVFETSIENRHAEFVLNVGSNNTISLDKALFSTLVYNHTIEVSRDGAGNGWFVKGELMGKSLVGLPVTSIQNDDGTSSLGPLWLCAFNLELDLQAHRWRYELRKNAPAPLTVRLMMGANFTFSGNGASVQQLRSDGGGPAEKAGLEVGDTIQVFDTLRGDDLNIRKITEVVTAKAGKGIEVQYHRALDGQVVTTTLRLTPAISEWNFPGRDIFNGAGKNAGH